MNENDFENAPLFQEYLDAVAHELLSSNKSHEEIAAILEDIKTQICSIVGERPITIDLEETVIAALEDPRAYRTVDESISNQEVEETFQEQEKPKHNKKALYLAIASVVLLALLFISIGIQRKTVSLHEEVNKAEAQLENALQRRYDLIPNLVSTVKAYAQHERELFEKVSSLRNQWANAGSFADKTIIDKEMSTTLPRVVALVENYPQIKADQSFNQLMISIEGTENRVSVERMRYNQAIGEYNSKIRKFPDSLIASLSGMKTKNLYFKAEQQAQKAPKVSF